jgi:hypothetical protein
MQILLALHRSSSSRSSTGWLEPLPPDRYRSGRSPARCLRVADPEALAKSPGTRNERLVLWLVALLPDRKADMVSDWRPSLRRHQAAVDRADFACNWKAVYAPVCSLTGGAQVLGASRVPQNELRHQRRLGVGIRFDGSAGPGAILLAPQMPRGLAVIRERSCHLGALKFTGWYPEHAKNA